MARFFTTNDVNFIDSINKELINEIIDTRVDIYKVNEDESTTNVYDEVINKIYFPQVRVAGLIVHEEPTYDQDDFGPHSSQNITINFHRNTLVGINLYLEVGDVIVWDTKHFIISSLIDNQYLAGRTTLKHSIKCHCYQTKKSTSRIERIKKMIAKQKDSDHE